MSHRKIRRHSLVMALAATCLLLLATACATPEGAVGEPTSTAEAAPTGAVIATPDAVADQAYISCIQDSVLPSAQDFAQRFAVAVPLATQNATDFCTGSEGAGDMPGEIEALVLLHEECPAPSSDCAIEAHRLLGLALDELTLGVGAVEEWCESGGNVSDISTLVGEAIGRMASAGSFLTSTVTKLQECAAELPQ